MWVLPALDGQLALDELTGPRPQGQDYDEFDPYEPLPVFEGAPLQPKESILAMAQPPGVSADARNPFGVSRVHVPSRPLPPQADIKIRAQASAPPRVAKMPGQDIPHSSASAMAAMASSDNIPELSVLAQQVQARGGALPGPAGGKGGASAASDAKHEDEDRYAGAAGAGGGIPENLSPNALELLLVAMQQSKAVVSTLMEEVDLAAISLIKSANDAAVSRFAASVQRAFKQESTRSGPLAAKLHTAFKQLLDEHHAYLEIVREGAAILVFDCLLLFISRVGCASVSWRVMVRHHRLTSMLRLPIITLYSFFFKSPDPRLVR